MKILFVQIIFVFITVDQAIQSFEKCFKQLETCSDNFRLSHRIIQLKTMENENVLKHCKNVQTILTNINTPELIFIF